MEPVSAPSPTVKKQEDDDKADKRDIKPMPKTLNRVPRACNACRKQKMRCEGADNPPCKRCRNNGLECLFEKPSREATLTGEAGLERIRSLEAHVVDIRQTQTTIQNTLTELVHQLRTAGINASSPSAGPPAFHPSPSVNSPSVSTPTVSNQHASPSSAAPFPLAHASASNAAPPRQHGASLPNTVYPGTVPGPTPRQHILPETHTTPVYIGYPEPGQGFNIHGQINHTAAMNMGPPQGNMLSVRYHSPRSSMYASGSKRNASSSNVTSADSSDFDDEDEADLPAYGLVAPWLVLRGLATNHEDKGRVFKYNGDISEPQSRTRTPSPDRRGRNKKRRKLDNTAASDYPDVVTKGVITEAEARELFKIFYDGCSTFLPVFDSNKDTFDHLHQTSPFSVNAICLVGARVRDGGEKMSELHRKCLEEAESLASCTLFSSKYGQDVVQSMILIAGWSDNGWLSGGHAVRMAMDLSMHRAWPRLLKRMNMNKGKGKGKGKVKEGKSDDLHLVVATRTWFCLYLFEHQISYGTGRPAVLKDDESIRDCRHFLNHPSAIEDDMRLVSTVELITIRERVHNALSPLEGPVRPEHFEVLRRADIDFGNWYSWWDAAFSGKYEDAAFYRQSLQIQHLHAELFHNATALRDVDTPEEVEKMPKAQRELACRSIRIAQQGLDITLNSPAYRKGMTYAVHYTHATATFAALFLLRLARLFPDECDTASVENQVNQLSHLLIQIPGRRYAMTLQFMLYQTKRRRARAARSPKVAREPQQPLVMAVDAPVVEQPVPMPVEVPVPGPEIGPPQPFSPTYDINYPMGDAQMHGPQVHADPMHQQYPTAPFAVAEHIWNGIIAQAADEDEVPAWMTDRLGAQTFSQQGMDSFIIPSEFLPSAQRIW